MVYKHRNQRNKKSLRNDSKVEVQEDYQEIIEHNDKKEIKSEEQEAQEVLGHESEQQQET